MYQVKQLTRHVEGEILLFSFAEIIDLPHNNLPENRRPRDVTRDKTNVSAHQRGVSTGRTFDTSTIRISQDHLLWSIVSFCEISVNS